MAWDKDLLLLGGYWMLSFLVTNLRWPVSLAGRVCNSSAWTEVLNSY